MIETETQLRTRELKPGFGAEILDVDLASADAATREAVVEVFHRSGARPAKSKYRSANRAEQIFTSLQHCFAFFLPPTVDQFGKRAVRISARPICRPSSSLVIGSIFQN